jgi:hypothetical protein
MMLLEIHKFALAGVARAERGLREWTHFVCLRSCCKTEGLGSYGRFERVVI